MGLGFYICLLQSKAVRIRPQSMRFFLWPLVKKLSAAIYTETQVWY